MSYNLKKIVLSGSSLAALMLPLGAATAQTVDASKAASSGAQEGDAQNGWVQDVIVTAERRTSTAQRTAASVSVRSGDDLLERGKYSLRSILEDVPGIAGGARETAGASIVPGSDNPASSLVIRGIPSNQPAGGAVTSTAAAAAIYVDDVYSGIGGNYDIDRVEVLRGPQGTLYGRSATSGVVAIRARDPDLTDVNADLSSEVGTYGLGRIAGALNVPIVNDKIAIRASGSHYERDGFDSPRGGRRINNDGRIKLLIKPIENFSALFGAAFQNNVAYSGGISIQQSPIGVFTRSTLPTVRSENQFRQFWTNMNVDLGGIGVTYIGALRTYTSQGAIIIPGLPSLQQTVTTPRDHFWTHELRLNSQGDSALQWQAGALSYLNDLRDNSLTVQIPANILNNSSTQHKRTRAVGAFAEATWRIQPETRINAGVRYDYTQVQTEQVYTGSSGLTRTISGDEGKRTFNNFTYKARVEHDLAPTNMVYAAISTGFSPGDVALATNGGGVPVVTAFKAQTLTAYEIGSKNRFLNNRLQLNAAIFYNDYQGSQTAVNLNEGQLGVPAAFRSVTTPLRSYGGEFELVSRPWKGGTIGLNMAYTHARYHDIAPEFAALFGSNEVFNVIPFQSVLSLDQAIPIKARTALTLHGDVRYLSAHNINRVSASQLALAAPYARNSASTFGNVSATLSFEDGRLTLTGYVRNVTDKRILSQVTLLAVTQAAVLNTTVLTEPRTYGLVAAVKF